jgi:hypothetical protein
VGWATVLVATPAVAVTVITFSTGDVGAGGTFTVSGTNASGSGIPIDLLTVAGAPMNNGVFDLSGAGPNGTGGDTNGSALLSFDTAIGSNFITITGDVAAPLSIPNTTLLSGSFVTHTLVPVSVIPPIFILTGNGPDTKAPALLAALGLPTSTPFEFFDFTVGQSPAGPVFSTSISNIQQVPEPGALLLLGSGLIGLVTWRWAHDRARRRT